MSAEPEPASRDLSRAMASVTACVIIGSVGGLGEVAALIARHLMSASNVFEPVAIGFAGPVAGLVVGVLSLTGRGKRQ